MIERFKIICNIEHWEYQFKHFPYTSNNQQNLLMDLLINLRQHLEFNLEKLKELVLGLGKFFETSNINT